MPINSVMSSAQNGMQAAEKALEVSARNVASLSSRGAPTPATSNAEQKTTGGVSVTISKAAREMTEKLLSDGKAGAAPTDLVQEAVAQSLAVALYRANVQSMRASQEIDNTMQELVTRSAGT